MFATGAHSWSRLLSGAVAIGAGVAIAALCVAAAPAADATGSISGRVTNLAGEPLTNVGVSVSPDLPGAGGYAVTGTDGSYTVSGLASGSYRVQFYDPSTRYAGEYFDDARSWSEADLVQVAAGAERTGIDAVLALGGSVSGRVTNAAGEPLAEITVSGESAEPGGGFGASILTDADGGYTLRGLSAGSYRIRFADPGGTYAFEYYDDAISSNDAMLVTVAAGEEVAGIDATLAPGGSVSGRVTNESGAPLEGISVSASSTSSAFATAVTDADGRYTVAGLGPGSYRVWFFDTRGRGYVAEYYDDASYFAATLIDVGFGTQVAGIDAVLAVGASLSGRVTNEAGEPLADVSVGATPLSPGEAGMGATTGPDGTYRIIGLRAAPYRVRFSDMRGRGYVSEYYDDELTSSAAQIFTVAAGADVTGIDAVLSIGGSISGRVTDAADNPLLQVSVMVLGLSGDWFAAAATAADGTYRVTGVPAGGYRVQFVDYRYRGYVAEFYDDAPTLETATPVVVVGSEETTGIDAELVLGGSISGRVTNEAGQALEGVSVSVSTTSGAAVNAQSGADGRYTAAGLGPGSYRVWFSDARGRGYVGEYYEDTTVWAEATLLTITGATVVEGIDAALEIGGSISGRVTSAAGEPLGNVGVTAYSIATGAWGGSVASGADGTYRIIGVRAGIYRVSFNDGLGRGYVTEYYDDAVTSAAATPVQVAAGEDTSGIDAELVLGGSISGRVTNEAGQPLEGVSVNVTAASGASAYGLTGLDGRYRISGVGTGSYRVWFSDGRGRGYASEYYDDAASWSAARVLTVAAGTDLTGIDAVLTLGGSVSGRVVNPAGDPLAGIYVSIYDVSGSRRIQTGADGMYSFPGLLPGSYRIGFADATKTYADEYHEDAGSLDAATPVAVTAGGTVRVDASLAPGGSISGRVTNAAGEPLAGITVSATPFPGSGTTATTAADGTYTLRGLRSSTYRVAFIDGGPRGYIGEYFDDVTRWESATSLSVGAGSELLGIDAELELGGSISGRVTNAGGTPLEGVLVLATPSLQGLGGYARTAADGSYTVYGLGAGPYRVHFIDFSDSYEEEYFDNHASSTAATLVSLDDREAVTGIDASLGRIGTVSEQSIAFPPLSGKTFGDPDFAAGASASSGLPVTYAASGSCTVADGVVHLTGAGSCTLTASQRGDDVYYAAPDVTRMFAVTKASQTIDFAPLEGRTWGDPDFDVAASASSGLPVVFTATGGCTVSGRTVRLSDVGACAVTASQAGDADYEPAADVSRTFVVAWPFTGFLAPLGGDDVVETKAGSTVPLKFSLGGAWGLDVLAPGSPRSMQVACPTGAPQYAPLPAEGPGSSRLSFEDGVYHYGWKTEAGWAGTCRLLVVELRDTTVHAVTFSLR